MGISYLTHSQGIPNKVADFSNIERINTYVLPSKENSQQQSTTSSSSSSSAGHQTNELNNLKGNNNSITNSPASNKKLNSEKKKDSCNCSEIKTQIKIKVTGNIEDLSFTCNGIKVSLLLNM